MRTFFFFLSDVWIGDLPDQVIELIDVLMGWINHSFVHSKIFNERILGARHWRYGREKKIGFYLHGIYIWLGLVDKLMNKNIEIKSNINFYEGNKKVEYVIKKGYLLRDTLNRIIRNCFLRKWHLFDLKDQNSEFH